MKKVTIEINNELIDEKALQRLINSIEKSWSSIYAENIEGIHKQVTDLVAPHINKYLKINSAILDIGCGNGETMLKFKEMGHSVTGITMDDEDISNCKMKNLEVKKMDQSFLQFAENSFDFIWARHVLEHSFMPFHTLREFLRICKPEGYLYIEVPAADSVFNHAANPNHFSIYSKNNWIELFKKNDLIIVDSFDINSEGKAVDNSTVEEVFWGFLLMKAKSQMTLALSKGENFGWGVCSNYLKKELSKINSKIEEWDHEKNEKNKINVKGKVVHALTNINFDCLGNIWGDENYGYTFFENELNNVSVENAKKFNLVLGGSTWNKEKMIEKGITNAGVLIQGIDPLKFYPGEQRKDDCRFIIFSGGKFELRKGQDILLKAIGILQEKYNDIFLVNAWFNMWPESMKLMQNSKYIKFEYTVNEWPEFMKHIYDINMINSENIITLDIVNHNQLRDIYLNTDIGIFPNRCEGGTNLVLMEYMACGKPVIASYNSGHKDILTNENSLMLKQMKPYKIFSGDDLWANWEEPELDELISHIEYAYNNREIIKIIGETAGKYMQKYTWAETASSLLRQIS